MLFDQSEGGDRQQEIPETTLAVEGCFGHSVLLGQRRPATYVAHSHSELITIDKGDLVKLFAADPL